MRNGDIKGADDLLAARGPEAVRAMIAKASPVEPGPLDYPRRPQDAPKQPQDGARDARVRPKVIPLDRAQQPKRSRAADALDNVHTDLNASEVFTRDHADRFRYCGALGWLVWDEARWARDEKERAHDLAKDTARKIQEYAGRTGSEKHWKLARSLGRPSGVEGLLDLSRSDPTFRVEVGELDRDPYLLNVANGTIDLRTGELRAHDRADLLTKLAPVRYDPDAKAPRFDSFISEILPDDEIRAYVQRHAGYAASAVIREHTLPVWLGGGSNGKSTLAEVFQAVLGDYAGAMPEGFLAERKHDKHETEIARLRGMRLAVASETKEGCSLDEAKLKRLTGGDTLTAHYMHKDHFQFAPSAKFVLFTNHEPRLRGIDEGIRRRVVLVPFDVTIPEARRDGSLKDRVVSDEGAGVLAWIVRGAIDWYQRGEKLMPPARIVDATRDYHTRHDGVGRFIAECCRRGAPVEREDRITLGKLHAAFVCWARDAGVSNVPLRDFSDAIRAHGLDASQKSGSARHLTTICLAPDSRSLLTGGDTNAAGGSS
jgi:putative DNA primase/helicase